ncbi:diaminopimelate decarboxylase [Leucobacter exalbidus]|uniref:Diaminopimelate decarboxylase n=1 Tax=Leucobacter exalbidus TaxID=662960 RepID=A0A940T3C0_9MICO|nr:diaminopimelate decarboxylase [Leucobacter exalbidus]MBP1325668.1 diaminopimelate decarboxylase [Leucobacter exalbidus]
MTEPTQPADLNAIDTRVFPPTARRGNECRELKIGEIRATDLTAQFGSPLYVIDEGAARAKAREVFTALTSEAERIGTSATVYYAGKAFLCVEVAAWMAEEGLAIDVASGGELSVALAAGVKPEMIGFHGNNKSVSEIDRAVAAGVGTIIIDSEIEIERVAQAAAAHGRVQRVRLRVNSGVHASTHDFLATSHEDQKFGQPLAAAPRLASLVLAHASLDFVGLHCHIGSQIFATEGFRESAKRLLSVYPELAKLAGRDIPELNLGGGFGIAYTPDQAADAPEVSRIARELADIVAESCAAAGVPVPKLAFEPGRAIIGQSGVTLYTVGTTKTVQLAGSDAAADPADQGFSERLYVSVDGGMSDNARPALYGADYHVRIANRVSAADAALVRVVGKHCESGDIVVQRDLLPGDVRPGDTLAVATTGAYCWSLASNYNYVPRPPVVAVTDGRARLIVHGETEAELLAKSVTGAADWAPTPRS